MRYNNKLSKFLLSATLFLWNAFFYFAPMFCFAMCVYATRQNNWFALVAWLIIMIHMTDNWMKRWGQDT